MILRKKLRKFWRRTFSHGPDNAPLGGSTSLQPISSDPVPPGPFLSPSSAPAFEVTPEFEGHTQTANRLFTTQASTPIFEGQGYLPPAEIPGIFAGSHDFVLRHPVIGENIQLHYHGNDGRLKPPSDEASRSSVSRSPLEKADTIDLSREAGKPTFIAHNVHVHGNDRDSELRKAEEERLEKKRRQRTLKTLREYTIPGAEYNSSERDPPPRCHPGTRIAIREEFRTRIEGPNQGTRLIWMHGPAGVGKSAIMQTVVEEVLARCVCGTLFFSRPNNCDDAKKCFTSLAYGLAVASPEYCEYLATCIENDPTCLTKSLDDQFKMLFITPFVERRVKVPSQLWVMFIDGLDECQNTRDSDNQRRIMEIIGDSTFRHMKYSPLVWIIASRHEENLKSAWSQIQWRFQTRSSELWELPIPVDSDQAAQDVEFYLHTEFEKIRTNYISLIPQQSRWPSDIDFSKIAKKSSGLFVFAWTVTRYISDEDPVYRLQLVVSLIDRTEQRAIAGDEKPFHMVDLLYISIMADVPKRLLPIAKSLLGIYHILGAVVVKRRTSTKDEPKLGLAEACNILGVQQNAAYAALRKLQSVLICPTPSDAQYEGIRFFHASFPDFFLNKTRSGTYHVDLDQELTNVWRRYAHILKEFKTAQGHTGISIYWLPDDNVFLLSGFQKRLLSRAQNGWIKILVTSAYSRTATKSLQVDIPELIETFENLGPSFLAGDRLPIQEFLDWLDNSVPPAIQEKIILERINLHQLDKEHLLKCLCKTPRYQCAQWGSQGYYSTTVDLIVPLAELSSWAQAKSVFSANLHEFFFLAQDLEDLFLAETARVTIIGPSPSESCAVVGPFINRFYVLPYSLT